MLPQSETRPAAFLDRDGVLNRDTGYVHRARDIVWIDNAKQAVKRLNDAGYFVFVVTNQSGIARGLYRPAEVDLLHRWMNDELRAVGAHIDQFYVCPHHPDGVATGYGIVCDCRKPKPGLLLQAMREWPVRREGSLMIGDKAIDVEAAKAAGIRGIRFDPNANLDAAVSAALSRS